MSHGVKSKALAMLLTLTMALPMVGAGTAQAEDCFSAENSRLGKHDSELVATAENVRLTSGNGYSFSSDNGTLTVTSNAGTTSWRNDVDIAANQTDRYNAIKSVVVSDAVTEIGGSAFLDCANLVQATLPSSITSIEASAFKNCAELKLTALPKGVQTIGKSAFEYCPNIALTFLSDSVEDIGIDAFYRCASIQEMTFPVGLSSIEGHAFDNCYQLAKLTFQSAAPPTIDASAFNDVSSVGTIYYRNSASGYTETWKNGFARLTNWVLQPFIHTDDYSFYPDSGTLIIRTDAGATLWRNDVDIAANPTDRYNAIKSVVVSGDVTAIAYEAFSNCTNLARITLLDGVTSIEASAFESCTNLVLTQLPKSVQTIGKSAFENCPNIAMTSLPDSVKSIGNNAFSGCAGIQEMAFPSGLSSIGVSAFSSCSSLAKLTFRGAAAPLVGEHAFRNVSPTGTIYYPGGYPSDWLDRSDLPAGWMHVSSYRLTVENGIDKTNAPFYLAGERVTVEAQKAPDGHVFAGWIALNGGSFDDASRSTTTFTMPNSNATVRATYVSIAPSPDPVNATITLDKASFDCNPSSTDYQEISLTLLSGSYTLDGIFLDTTILQAGRDYTEEGSTYTFPQSYLASLSVGAHTLTFNMDGGTDPALALTVIDTTPSGEDPAPKPIPDPDPNDTERTTKLTAGDGELPKTGDPCGNLWWLAAPLFLSIGALVLVGRKDRS